MEGMNEAEKDGRRRRGLGGMMGKDGRYDAEAGRGWSTSLLVRSGHIDSLSRYAADGFVHTFSLQNGGERPLRLRWRSSRSATE